MIYPQKVNNPKTIENSNFSEPIPQCPEPSAPSPQHPNVCSTCGINITDLSLKYVGGGTNLQILRHRTPHSLLGKIELFTSCNLCAQCIKLPLPPAPTAPPRATGAPVITKTQFSLNMTNDHNLGPAYSCCSVGAHYANLNRQKTITIQNQSSLNMFS